MPGLEPLSPGLCSPSWYNPGPVSAPAIAFPGLPSPVHLATLVMAHLSVRLAGELVYQVIRSTCIDLFYVFIQLLPSFSSFFPHEGNFYWMLEFG